MWHSKTGTSVLKKPLEGVRLGIVGSSSADPDYGQKNFYEHIADRTGIVLFDYADAGSLLTASTSDYTAEPKNQLKRIDELPAALDIVIAQPCANDDNQKKPIGTFASREVTDVYGALHIMCQKLLTKYPEIPVGVMTPQYFGTQAAQTSVYNEAITEVCGYYGIPVVDLKREGQTPYHLPFFKQNYCEDSLHLNEAGHKILSRRVERFIRDLMMV